MGWKLWRWGRGGNCRSAAGLYTQPTNLEIAFENAWSGVGAACILMGKQRCLDTEPRAVACVIIGSRPGETNS